MKMCDLDSGRSGRSRCRRHRHNNDLRVVIGVTPLAALFTHGGVLVVTTVLTLLVVLVVMIAAQLDLVWLLWSHRWQLCMLLGPADRASLSSLLAVRFSLFGIMTFHDGNRKIRRLLHEEVSMKLRDSDSGRSGGSRCRRDRHNSDV